jgi:N-acetylglucosamine kinase-like BadF-type ATPase
MRWGLGVDGGGMQTNCVPIDESRAIRGRARPAPANPVLMGTDTAAEALLRTGPQCRGLSNRFRAADRELTRG